MDRKSFSRRRGDFSFSTHVFYFFPELRSSGVDYVAPLFLKAARADLEVKKKAKLVLNAEVTFPLKARSFTSFYNLTINI